MLSGEGEDELSWESAGAETLLYFVRGPCFLFSGPKIGSVGALHLFWIVPLYQAHHFFKCDGAESKKESSRSLCHNCVRYLPTFFNIHSSPRRWQSSDSRSHMQTSCHDFLVMTGPGQRLLCTILSSFSSILVVPKSSPGNPFT